MRVVEVVVDGDGTVVVRYSGFRGRECFDEAAKLYRALSSMGLKVRVERVEEVESHVEAGAVARGRGQG